MLAETFFAHYRMSEMTIAHIAKGNAAVNLCLTNNAIDKNVAYAYSNVSAQLLDISVLDRDFYKQSYQKSMEEFKQEFERIDARVACVELEKGLPKVTQDYANLYMKISSELSMARAQERQQMATMLSNFGSNWSQPNYPINMNWPNVQYVAVEPQSTNYLVNTSKGLINCRTTNKNYVFCF